MSDLEAAAQATMAASRALLGVVASSMAPVSDRITVPQFRILVLLSGLGPVSIGVVARHLGVHPSTLSRTADRLVDAGFVRRAENPDSRRERLLGLTPAGRRLVRSVMQRRERRIRSVLETLSEDQRAMVAEALSLFAEAAGEPEAGAAAEIVGA